MHKGIIILTKADNRFQAIAKVQEYMKNYKDNVWDWYVIGGRWTQTLAPQTKEFEKVSAKITNSENKEYIGQQIIDDNQILLQQKWQEMGGLGQNPYTNHYNLPNDGQENDVLPLEACIEKVKEWQQTTEHAKAAEKEAQEWLNRKDKNGNLYDDWNMYGYTLACAAELYQQNFSFEANVYNIEKWNFSIPENIKDFYAVIIDMHN